MAVIFALCFTMAIVLAFGMVMAVVFAVAVFVFLIAFGFFRLGQAVRHHFDFFTRCEQAQLGGADGVFAVAQLGHLQSFAEGFQRGGVFGAFGQQADGTQADLALGGQ